VQGTGEGNPFSLTDLNDLLLLSRNSIHKLLAYQKHILENL